MHFLTRLATAGNRRRLATLAVVCASFWACHEQGTGPHPYPTASQLVQGDGQVGVVGTVLPQPLLVLVTDRTGQPLAGVGVEFRIANGGGALDAARSITDDGGRARATWTLGGVAGMQQVSAVVEGLPLVKFTATAKPDQPASIQLAPDSLTLDALGDSARLAVSAHDRFGNAVSGAAMTWVSSDSLVATVDSSGKIISRANGQVRVTAASGTKADTARITVAQRGVTFAIATGQRTINAIGDTVPFHVEWRDRNGFAAPSTAGPALAWTLSEPTVATVSGSGMLVSSGVGQTRVVARAGAASDSTVVVVRQVVAAITLAPPGTLAAGAQQQLHASAADSNGVTAPAAVFAWQSTDTAVARVDAAGQVRVRKAGVSDISATASTLPDGPTLSTSARLTVVAGDPAAVSVVSGDLQGATAATPLARALTVRVMDAYGNPTLGRPVQWSVLTGGGSVSPAVVNVGADGLVAAALTVGSVVGLNTVQAAVGGMAATFTAAGAGQIGAAGGVLRVPGDLVTITIPAGALAGPTALTITPLASVPADPTFVPGTSFEFGPSMHFNAPVQVKVSFDPTLIPAGTTPAQLKLHRVTSGSWQEMTGNVVDLAASTVTTPLASFSAYALLGERPVASMRAAPDTIVLTSTGATQAIAVTLSDVLGRVLDSRPFGYATADAAVATVSSQGVVTAVGSGTTAVTVSVGTLSAAVGVRVRQDAATVAVTPATSALAALAATQQLAATAYDAGHTAVSGSPFTWITSDAAVATVSASGLVTVVGNGVATITATSAGVAGTATITVQQIATSMAMEAGDAQSVTVQHPVPIAPAVIVRDANGHPIPGVSVDFNVTSGGGAVAGSPAVTGADGIARVGSWTVGGAAGANGLTASAGPLSAPFTATGTYAASAQLTKTAGDGGTSVVGATRTLQVRVADAFGNAVAGQSVAWAATVGTGGAVSAASSPTDAAGIATVTWTVDTTAGLHSATATVAGLGGSPAAFTATALPGAADAAHSTISASPAGLPADGASTAAIVVNARDSYNNALTTGGGAVALSNAGTGALSPVTDAGDGRYTATLTAPVAVGSASITATLGGVAVPGSATVSFGAGALHHFTVESAATGPIPTQSASTLFNIRITARDAHENVVTSFIGTVDITSNRTGTAGLATTAAFVNGVLTSHSVTLTTPAGVGATITATRTGGTETGTSTAFTVNPGGLHHFLVEAAGAGALGTQTAATPFAIRLTAQDVGNNTVTSFTGTADVSSNRAGSSGLTTTSAFTAGVLASHGVTLTQSGTLSAITATRTGGTESGTSATFTVNSGALHHFVVDAAGGGAIGTQTVSVPFNVRVTAQDANSNTVTGFIGTVDVTSTRTGSSGLATSGSFIAGVLASHAVTLTQSGAPSTVTVTRTGSAETGTSNSFSVDPGTVHHFVVEAAGGGPIPTQAAGTPFNVKVTAVDASGNVATSFTGTADITSNRTGTAGLATTAAFVNGVLASYSVTLTTPTGAGGTITATRNGGTETGTSVAFALNAGGLHHFLVEKAGGGPIATQAAGVPFNVQITAQDAFNNTAAFTGTVVVSSNRSGTAGLTTTAAFTAGVLASHSVTLTTPVGAGAAITVTRSGGTETGTSTAFALVAGAVHHFVVEAQGGGNIGVQGAGVPFNIQITAQDLANNTVTSFTGTVELTSNRLASAGINVTSPAFTAGVLASHGVTMTQTGAGATITATRSPAGPEFGTSNTFTVRTPPTVTTTTPANTAVSVARNATIVVNFSASVNATLASFTLECPAGAGRTFTVSAAPSTSYTLTPSSAMPAGTTCRVTVNAAQVTDAASGTPMASNSVFSFETTPSTGIDTYPQTVIGNMSVQSANVGVPYSVTTNDVSANSFTITSYDATSAHGGNVSLTTSGPNMGQFTYNPPAGYGHGSNDTFTYTITTSGGSTAIGTVTMPISGMVWYVDANAGVNGDGRMSNPFNNLQSLAAINDGIGNHPAAHDNILLYESPTAYVGPLTLLANQKLIGQDATASMQAITQLTPPSSSVAFPVTNPNDGVNTTITSPASGITVTTGDTLRGFRIGGDNGVGTVNGTAIGGTVVGTLDIRDVAITHGVTGAALSLSGGTANVVMDSVFATGGTNNISLTNVAGSVNLGASQGTLTGASAAAINVTGGTVNLTVNAPVSQSNGASLVNVTGKSGGSVTLAGTLSCTASCTGVVVQNNTGGTVTFSNATKTINSTAAIASVVTLTNNTGSTVNFTNGGLAITTTTAGGFVASGGGTVRVNGTSNRITSTGGGTGLNVQNVTSNGLTFESISTTGAANGIVMVGTGSGGLTVTGTSGRCDAGSTSCTGGTITGASGGDGVIPGNGIYLSSAPNVSLTRMRVNGTVQNFGLYGNTVSGLALNTMLFDGTFGSQTAEAALGFDELQGSASITGSSILPASGSWGDNIRVTNTTGTPLDRLTMISDTVGFTGNNGVNGVNILARGSNTTNVSILTSVLKGGKNKTFVFTDSVNATSNLVFTGNIIEQNAGPYGPGALDAMNIRVSGAATLTDSINSNIFRNLTNPSGAALNFDAGLTGLGLSGSANSYIGHNNIGQPGGASSGSAQSSMNLNLRGSGTHTMKVADNQIYQYGSSAFRATATGDGSLGAGHSGGKVDLTFVRNTIAEPRAGATNTTGVQLQVGSAADDSMTVCVNFGVGGLNDINNSGSTDANLPFNIVSLIPGNGSFLKFLNYPSPEPGSVSAGSNLNILMGAGITGWAPGAFNGAVAVTQAAWITSSTDTDNTHGKVCNLPPAAF